MSQTCMQISDNIVQVSKFSTKLKLHIIDDDNNNNNNNNHFSACTLTRDVSVLYTWLLINEQY